MDKISNYIVSVGRGSAKIIKAGSGERDLSGGHGAVIFKRVVREGLPRRGSFE